MSVSFLPMLRLYRLSPLRALSLPLIALMYAAMTADSARRHHAGRGGEWKGRTIQAASVPAGGGTGDGGTGDGGTGDGGPVAGEAVGSGRGV